MHVKGSDNLESINRVTQTIKSQEVQSTQNVQRDLKPNQSEFLKRFEKIKSDDVRVKLESIFGEIVDKSERLKETLSLKELMEYKKLVKEFMGIAVENSHVFSQNNSLDRRGRRRVYSMINQVDRELDSITRDFVSNHVDHAKVLSSIDVIRGLLVDIMG